MKRSEIRGILCGEDFLHLPLPHRWHGAFYALRPLLWTLRKARKAWRPAG